MEQRADSLRSRIAEFSHLRFGLWAVVERSSGELAGYCGLQLFLLADVSRASYECELYYKLGREFWGRGYATPRQRHLEIA